MGLNFFSFLQNRKNDFQVEKIQKKVSRFYIIAKSWMRIKYLRLKSVQTFVKFKTSLMLMKFQPIIIGHQCSNRTRINCTDTDCVLFIWYPSICVRVAHRKCVFKMSFFFKCTMCTLYTNNAQFTHHFHKLPFECIVSAICRHLRRR